MYKNYPICLSKLNLFTYSTLYTEYTKYKCFDGLNFKPPNQRVHFYAKVNKDSSLEEWEFTYKNNNSFYIFISNINKNTTNIICFDNQKIFPKIETYFDIDIFNIDEIKKLSEKLLKLIIFI